MNLQIKQDYNEVRPKIIIILREESIVTNQSLQVYIYNIHFNDNGPAGRGSTSRVRDGPSHSYEKVSRQTLPMVIPRLRDVKPSCSGGTRTKKKNKVHHPFLINFGDIFVYYLPER